MHYDRIPERADDDQTCTSTLSFAPGISADDCAGLTGVIRGLDQLSLVKEFAEGPLWWMTPWAAEIEGTEARVMKTWHECGQPHFTVQLWVQYRGRESMDKQPTVHVFLDHSETYVWGNIHWYKGSGETRYRAWKLKLKRDIRMRQ
ncbi:hypothetical protein HBI56_075070 [Parastagonospora nodorum]|nr:hypothetical protein HBH56_169920 [Parastagonospora nodorum]KAH3928664.1 hypothetical protein HBH54_138470 [Parastagonospora nodorum]KAH3945301.1 hypothetical protein HBH53_143820 [Parastagonospora nodorum]KAH3983912.1 hypothetical protein HBH52_060400 [Parastagonospora nodorum]KAH3985602.1 hypothetical protein HBH51_019230 [Parastagonospora nodorum]